MPMPKIPIANKLLASLPRTDYARLQTSLEPVTLAFGEVLYEPGDTLRQVYFPNDSLVSLLILVDHHLALEVGLIGYEGVVGLACALGVSVSQVRALVQGSGTAMRMDAASFRRAFRQSPMLQRSVLLYAHTLMAQIAQTAACNRFHVVEARLARWLLMTRDRVGSENFHLTQEFLSHMLGVRREGVTQAAQTLKQRHLIDYRRGNIAIVDGHGLEAASCSCYERIRGKLPAH